MIRVGDRVCHRHYADIGTVYHVSTDGYVWVRLDRGERMGAASDKWAKVPPDSGRAIRT